LRRSDNRIFEGLFLEDFPIAGVYTDQEGASCHVVFKARTHFSKIAEVGEAVFLTKTPLEVRSKMRDR
jgi:hypothetical protein